MTPDPSPSTKPALTVEQEAFKKWQRTLFGKDYLTDHMWLGWQASRRRTLEEIIAKLRTSPDSISGYILAEFADKLEAELNSKETGQCSD